MCACDRALFLYIWILSVGNLRRADSKENASHHCEVSAWLAGLTSLLAPTHDGNGQLMVYHAGDSDQPLSCDIRLLLECRLESGPFRGKFLFLRSTGEESSYLPRPAWTLQTSLDLCLRLRLHSPRCIDHVPTSRFRVERLPRGPEGLRPPDLSTRFEAFPAVYRAPSLIWHRSVMNSRSFSDSPDPRDPMNSYSRSSVSPAKGNRPTRSLLGRGGYRIGLGR